MHSNFTSFQTTEISENDYNKRIGWQLIEKFVRQINTVKPVFDTRKCNLFQLLVVNFIHIVFVFAGFRKKNFFDTFGFESTKTIDALSLNKKIYVFYARASDNFRSKEIAALVSSGYKNHAKLVEYW